MCEIGVADAGASAVRGQFLEQRPAGDGAEQAIAFLQRRLEHGLIAHELATHAPPLWTHAREDEREARLAIAWRPAVGDRCPGLAVKERVEMVSKVLLGTGHGGEAMLVVAAAHGGRVAKVAQAERVAGPQPLRVSCRQLVQRVAAPRRDRQDLGGSARRRGGLAGRRFLEDGMRVGATEPERVHARRRRSFSRGPLLEGRWDTQSELVKGNRRVRLDEVDGRRNPAMPEGQSGLDHADDPRSGFQVAHVALDRTDEAGTIRRSIAGHHVADRPRLDRVADRCPRAMRLHVLHRAMERHRLRQAPVRAKPAGR